MPWGIEIVVSLYRQAKLQANARETDGGIPVIVRICPPTTIRLEAYKRRAKSDDSKRRKVNYHIGVLVMRCLHILSSTADAIVGKLASRFQGPCQILRKT